MPEGKINADWLIGDILDSYPETAPVFRERFGEGCFTCPGARIETLAFGSTMHGLDVDIIVGELNERIETANIE